MKKLTSLIALAFTSMGIWSHSVAMAEETLLPPGLQNTEIYNEENGNISGEVHANLFRTASGYVNMWQPEYYNLSGLSGQYLIDHENGEIYIYNPISRTKVNAYIKGNIDSEGNITVPCPQLVSGGSNSRYIVNCHYEETEFNFTYMPNEENPDLHFTLSEDGTLTLCEGDAIGLFYWMQEYVYDSDLDDYIPVPDSYVYTWTYDVDLSQNMRNFSEPALAPDKELTLDRWVIWGQQTNTYSPHFGGFTPQYVDACIDGNSFWIKGAINNDPDCWFKGDIVDDKIIFKTSYIGYGKNSTYFYYLLPGRSYYNEYGVVNEKTDEVIFSFDAEKKLLLGEDGQSLFINVGDLGFLMINRWINPIIKPVEDFTPTVPVTPQFGCYYPMESDEFGFFTFNMSAMDTNYNPLNEDNMYYEILIDGKPWEFIQDELGDIYTMQVEPDETFTYFPWNFFSSNLYSVRTEYSFYVPFDGYNTIGARSFYLTNEGNRLYSDPLIYDVNTDNAGIETIEHNHGDIVEVIFTNLSGVRVKEPEKGIYIKTNIYSDGTRNTQKVIYK